MVYSCTGNFPAHEQFGITSQIRRAAVSVPSNVAEGWARGSTKELARFLLISRGSLAEMETQISIASRLGYLAPESGESLMKLSSETGKLIQSTINTLKSKYQSQSPTPNP